MLQMAEDLQEHIKETKQEVTFVFYLSLGAFNGCNIAMYILLKFSRCFMRWNRWQSMQKCTSKNRKKRSQSLCCISFVIEALDKFAEFWMWFLLISHQMEKVAEHAKEHIKESKQEVTVLVLYFESVTDVFMILCHRCLIRWNSIWKKSRKRWLSLHV